MLNIFFRLGGIHGVIVISIYRFGNWTYYKCKIPLFKQLFWILYRIIDYTLVKTLLGSEFPAEVQIGKNLTLPHGGKGIIIEKTVVIGNNVTIFHQVTIGINYNNIGSPKIEDNVFIGTGAKILGHISIGTKSKIGANAVVITNVPPNTTAVGIPVRLIKHIKKEKAQ
ncbi:DapH/DapD/GlmU-related protein [Neobacillus sp. 179-C4.2 HS]|uniref:Serine acetyltransferase n=1 Tax=Neobacillus driksii TaxID=3035913 RepID=A0ABV4Z0Q0_9BACI|nr:DapH/DapD/GlmU-related protein [Neobacillus sp. 179.-C4.2 HS]MDP5195971.1 DapH/DapD/GlmU-related protein [Neobacillus sp. 179.-C4.2 HS]